MDTTKNKGIKDYANLCTSIRYEIRIHQKMEFNTHDYLINIQLLFNQSPLKWTKPFLQYHKCFL